MGQKISLYNIFHRWSPYANNAFAICEKTNSLEHRFMSVESFNFPLLIITYSQNLKTSLCIKEKFLSLFRNKMLTGNLPRRQLFCKFLCFRPMAIDYAAITKWKMSWFIIVKKTLLNLYFIHFKRLNKTNYFCYMCMQLTYRTRVISTRGYYSFWGFLEAILFSKINQVTKGASTIQERVLITPIRYFDF